MEDLQHNESEGNGRVSIAYNTFYVGASDGDAIIRSCTKRQIQQVDVKFLLIYLFSTFTKIFTLKFWSIQYCKDFLVYNFIIIINKNLIHI